MTIRKEYDHPSNPPTAEELRLASHYYREQKLGLKRILATRGD